MEVDLEERRVFDRFASAFLGHPKFLGERDGVEAHLAPFAGGLGASAMRVTFNERGENPAFDLQRQHAVAYRFPPGPDGIVLLKRQLAATLIADIFFIRNQAGLASAGPARGPASMYIVPPFRGLVGPDGYTACVTGDGYIPLPVEGGMDERHCWFRAAARAISEEDPFPPEVARFAGAMLLLWCVGLFDFRPERDLYVPEGDGIPCLVMPSVGSDIIRPEEYCTMREGMHADRAIVDVGELLVRPYRQSFEQVDVDAVARSINWCIGFTVEADGRWRLIDVPSDALQKRRKRSRQDLSRPLGGLGDARAKVPEMKLHEDLIKAASIEADRNVREIIEEQLPSVAERRETIVQTFRVLVPLEEAARKRRNYEARKKK